MLCVAGKQTKAELSRLAALQYGGGGGGTEEGKRREGQPPGGTRGRKVQPLRLNRVNKLLCKPIRPLDRWTLYALDLEPGPNIQARPGPARSHSSRARPGPVNGFESATRCYLVATNFCEKNLIRTLFVLHLFKHRPNSTCFQAMHGSNYVCPTRSKFISFFLFELH